jgi:glycosyltransferase involved in cell wall biosynthesis
LDKTKVKKRKVVLFTSLPVVGGHSTLTLGLCRLFSEWFEHIEVWVKVMPEHGHSIDAQKALEQQGCKVVLLSDATGHLMLPAVARAMWRNCIQPPDVFFALAMRNLSLVFRCLLARSTGIYFHITHDLNRRTRRWLTLAERLFTHLVFICPATYYDFGSRSGKCMWAPQSSELHGIDADAVLCLKREHREQSRERMSVGLLGRLTEEKGAQAILDFIRNFNHPCDFHVAGTGPFAKEFEALAASHKEDGSRVYSHGSYSPTKRMEFLQRFFGGIDWLLVPSLDEWETLSMVTLESLQHGTPVLCSKSGGLRSFGMAELGPAPEGVVRLVDPKDFGLRLREVLTAGPYELATKFAQCREHYTANFSDAQVIGRWREIVR